VYTSMKIYDWINIKLKDRHDCIDKENL